MSSARSRWTVQRKLTVRLRQLPANRLRALPNLRDLCAEFDFDRRRSAASDASASRVLHEIGRRRLHERGGQPLLPVVDAARELALDVLHELVDLALHLLDLAAHVEDDLDAGEVDAEIARQRQDRLELLEIFFRVQARVASVRDGFSSPSRSYSRSVCGWMLYFCATALIM